jgi:hypothetical protein
MDLLYDRIPQPVSHEAFIEMILTLWAIWYAHRRLINVPISLCEFLGASSLTLDGDHNPLKALACREALALEQGLRLHSIFVQISWK